MASAAAPGGALDSAIVFSFVIVFVLARRVISQRKGANFSVRSIFFTPIIYIILSAYFLIGLSALDVGIVAVAIIAGIAAGLWFGERGAEIFEKDGKIMYKRSFEVMAVWIVGYIIRLAADFFAGGLTSAPFASPAVATPIILGADIILAFSAGLLLGEAAALLTKHRRRDTGKAAQS